MIFHPFSCQSVRQRFPAFIRGEVHERIIGPEQWTPTTLNQHNPNRKTYLYREILWIQGLSLQTQSRPYEKKKMNSIGIGICNTCLLIEMDNIPDSASRMSSSLSPWCEIRVWFFAQVMLKSLSNPLTFCFPFLVTWEITTARTIMSMIHPRIMHPPNFFFLDGFFIPCIASSSVMMPLQNGSGQLLSPLLNHTTQTLPGFMYI